MEKVWNEPRTRAESEPRVKTHAQVRAVERYGRELNLRKIALTVLAGQARFLAPAHDGCGFYDVPYEENGTKTTVRVLMSADRTFVVTVLPQDAVVGKHNDERLAKIYDRRGKRKQEFFKRFEDDEDVTHLER